MTLSKSHPLIALRNVTFGYEPQQPVLQDVSLAIHPHDRIALTGRNGAGKSTLLHLAIGLLHPGSGYIEAYGSICRNEHDFTAVRRRVAILFQNSDDQLFCPTVLDDVAFGPLNLGQPALTARQTALQALDMLGITGYAGRITHRLSAGEKKLAALAGILAMAPDVLLLDEPAAGLDEDAQERVVNALENHSAALLTVSQDHEFLRKITRTRLLIENNTLKQAAAFPCP